LLVGVACLECKVGWRFVGGFSTRQVEYALEAQDRVKGLWSVTDRRSKTPLELSAA